MKTTDKIDKKEKNGLRRRQIIIGLICIALLFGAAAGSAFAKTNDSAVSISQEDGNGDYVKDVFMDAINQYADGELTYDEVAQYIAQMISKDLAGTNSFTDNQVDAMEVIIMEQVTEAGITTDIEDSKNKIEEITQLLEQQYQENVTNMTVLQQELTTVIEEGKQNNAITDAKIAELEAANKRVENWLNDAQDSLNQKINETSSELDKKVTEKTADLDKKIDDNTESITKMLTDLNDTLTNDINIKYAEINHVIDELTKDTNAQLQSLRDDITALEIKQASDIEELNEYLRDLIENNAELSKDENAATKQALLDMINNNADQSQAGMANLSNEIMKAIEDANLSDDALKKQIASVKDATAGDIQDLRDLITAIEIKQASDLSELNQYLVDLVENNATLSKEENAATKQALLDMINNNADTSEAGLQALSSDLLKAIEDANISDTALKNQIDSVKEATSGDIQALKDLITAVQIKQASDLSELNTYLSDVIENNAELSKSENEALKQSLLDMINNNSDTTEAGLQKLSSDILKAMEDANIKDSALKTQIDSVKDATSGDIKALRDLLAALELKQSNDLTQLNDALLNIINDNATLAKSENAALKQSLIDKINNNDDVTKAGLQTLSDDIAKAIADAGVQDKALSDQISTLKNATAGDINALKTLISNNKVDLTNLINTTKTELTNKIDALEKAATWSSSVTYDEKAYVTHYNGSVQRFYHSLKSGNKGHEPGTTAGNGWWEEVDTVALISEMQTQVDSLNSHISDKNGSGEQFQYGVSGSSRGYYVNGTFKPF
ncbi:MAG: hypothetical protein E7272_12685 [Pseudobutyrivibrio ruminis]|uniref:EF-hand domain-containing protein n=1 Tax=Pseudobutyrivibrio ruminis TaxID=46206 RepID=A0A927UE37_9FIRM|nr:hypothetical protein [Pseudobutyrivibrio ruminis]